MADGPSLAAGAAPRQRQGKGALGRPGEAAATENPWGSPLSDNSNGTLSRDSCGLNLLAVTLIPDKDGWKFPSQ